MNGLRKERKIHCWLFLTILVVANLVIVNGGNAAGGGCKVFLSPVSWSVSCQYAYNTRSMFPSANKEAQCAQTQCTLSWVIKQYLTLPLSFMLLRFLRQSLVLVCCLAICWCNFCCTFFWGSLCCPFALFMTLIFQPTFGVKVTIYASCIFRHPYWT